MAANAATAPLTSPLVFSSIACIARSPTLKVAATWKGSTSPSMTAARSAALRALSATACLCFAVTSSRAARSSSRKACFALTSSSTRWMLALCSCTFASSLRRPASEQSMAGSLPTSSLRLSSARSSLGTPACPSRAFSMPCTAKSLSSTSRAP
eukprot:3497281-Lingulodinium_polyedra.AAC.1